MFDIPGVYLHVKVSDNNFILLKLKNEFVEIMCEINSEYDEYMRYKNGKKVLYLRVLRAIYGCLESALRWYTLYKSTLEGQGFVLNLYDRCVANKVINGK